MLEVKKYTGRLCIYVCLCIYGYGRCIDLSPDSSTLNIHTHCCSLFNLAVVSGLEERLLEEGVQVADINDKYKNSTDVAQHVSHSESGSSGGGTSGVDVSGTSGTSSSTATDTSEKNRGDNTDMEKSQVFPKPNKGDDFRMFSDFRDPSLALPRENQWAACARAMTIEIDETSKSSSTFASSISVSLETEPDLNLSAFNRCCRKAGGHFDAEINPSNFDSPEYDAARSKGL